MARASHGACSLDRSVPGAADAVAVAVPAPSRAASMIARRRDGVADQRARAGADEAAGNRAAGAAAGERRSDQRAAAGAERTADQRALLLLGRVAARNGERANESQCGQSFLHLSPLWVQ